MRKLFGITGSGLAVLLLVSTLTLGPQWVWTTLRGVRDRTAEKSEEEKSDAQRVAEIRIALKDFDDTIGRFADKLSEVECRAQAAGRQVQELERELGKQRELLARARELLVSDKDTCQIGSRRYTRAEVNADALGRVARSEQLVKQLDSQRQLARQLDEAVVEARANRARAQSLRQEKKAELATLEARLQNARLLEEVHNLTDGLKSEPLGPQTELAQKFETFERRVHTAERHAQLADTSSKGGALVDYEGKSASVPNATDAINRFLADGDTVPSK